MDNWKNIRLELAPSDDFPAGSVSRAYLVRLPLDDGDAVDRTAFLESPHKATVRRYWSSEPDEAGLVLHAKGGWTMRCDGRAERSLKLEGRPLRLGQLIPVVEADGAILPFRVASVR